MRKLRITKGITDRNESASLKAYLEEITKIPKITPEEEASLANKIQAGNKRALDKLVKANLLFVVSVAKKYQHMGLSLNDLINEGNEGLIKAAKRFDATKGFKFISYAVWWSRQTILKALAETGKITHIPPSAIGLYTKAQQLSLRFEQENEREPTLEELAELMEMTKESVSIIVQGNARHIQLDEPLGEDGDSTRADMLIASEKTDWEVDGLSLKKIIKDILKPREADSIIAFFRLDGDNSPTLDDIREKYRKKSVVSVRKWKDKGLENLRKSENARVLKIFLAA